MRLARETTVDSQVASCSPTYTMASRLTVVLGCGEFGRKGGSLESKAAVSTYCSALA